jgi:lipoprotein-anchoring transpeptidase ErfK/SrfK
LRSVFSFAIVALALAGSAYGAAAQYYPRLAPGEEVYQTPPGGRPFFPSQPLPATPLPGYAPDASSPGARSNIIASLPPEDQPEQGPAKELSQRFRRQIVSFSTSEPAGTIMIDTPNTYLFLVLGNGRAIRYGVGVGREGFTWSGTERISRMKEWPDWFPPKEMIERQPYLPRFMAGGETNPLGARALYLGSTVYRIHGTNQPSTIGSFVSSGCIRLTNDDIEDLYNRVNVGTRVVVLPGGNPDTAALRPAVGR